MLFNSLSLKMKEKSHNHQKQKTFLDSGQDATELLLFLLEANTRILLPPSLLSLKNTEDHKIHGSVTFHWSWIIALFRQL